MTTDAEKKAKALGYSQGYQAGVRRAEESEKALREELIRVRQYNSERKDRFYCAALTGLLAGDRSYALQKKGAAEGGSSLAMHEVALWYADNAMKEVK